MKTLIELLIDIVIVIVAKVICFLSLGLASVSIWIIKKLQIRNNAIVDEMQSIISNTPIVKFNKECMERIGSFHRKLFRNYAIEDRMQIMNLKIIDVMCLWRMFHDKAICRINAAILHLKG